MSVLILVFTKDVSSANKVLFSISVSLSFLEVEMGRTIHSSKSDKFDLCISDFQLALTERMLANLKCTTIAKGSERTLFRSTWP